MSDPKDKAGGDLDLDWDVALDAWEKDLKDGGGTAEAPPMPQHAAEKPKPAPAVSRPLYKPPSADAVPPRPLPPRPGAPGRPAVATPVAAPRPAEPRPPSLSSPPPAPARDSLFDVADDDIPTRVPTGDEFGLDAPAEYTGGGAALLESIVGPRGEGEPGKEAPTKPPPALTLGEGEDDVDDLLGGLDAPSHVARPAAPAAPVPAAAPPAGVPLARTPLVTKAVPAPARAPAVAPKPGFSVPKPGALPARPAAPPARPGAFVPPRPPGPAAPKPAIATPHKPELAAKPVAPAPAPLPAAPASPPAAVGPRARAAAPGRDEADDALDAIFGDDAPPAPPPAAPPAAAEPPASGAVDDELDAIFGSPAPSTTAAPATDAFDDDAATTVARSPLEDGIASAAARSSEDVHERTTVPRSLLDEDARTTVARSPLPADDEPVTMLGDDDSSETMTVSDDDERISMTFDDEEPSATITVGDDLDELAPSASPAAPAPAAARRSEQAADRGAATALRTVRSRKPREERFRLVGRTPEAQAARVELLCALAERSSGPPRARLYASAAELAAGLGRIDEARELLARAHAADATDVTVLRAMRRAALERSAWSDAAKLLEAEAALPLSPAERAYALAALAEVRLTTLGDARGAAQAAKSALELSPRSASLALLLADASYAAGEDVLGDAAVERAATVVADRPTAAALAVDAARAAERAGDAKKALGLYARATANDPTALDAAVGEARAARRAGDLEQSARAARGVAEAVGDEIVAEAFTVRAARIAHLALGRPGDALLLAGEARSVPALRARSEAAIAARDAEAAVRALEGLAQAVGGTDRALALVELAEVKAGTGDWEGADTALRDAALADSTLGTIRVMREVLARRAGDPTRLARVVETSGEGVTGGVIAAAAKLARDTRAIAKERELLDRAIHEGEDPICADTIRLDAAAQDADPAETRAALRRQAERASPERRVGPLLALADLVARDGDAPQMEALLREARDGARGEAVVLRPLANAVAEAAPRDAAALWLEEAAAASGARSAYAATEAARALVRGAGDPAPALRRALDAHPGYLPAEWMLEQVARAQTDLVTLRQAHERLADLAPDAHEKAGRLVRAALLLAGDDPPGAVALFTRAREVEPRDAIVRDLLLRFAGEMPAGARAMLLAEAGGQDASPQVRRAARLRAAAAHEDAGAPDRAAALYRAVLGESEGDAFAVDALERTELAQGDVGVVSERRFAAVRDAADDAARVLALERLAELDLRDRGDANSAMLSLQALLETAPGHVPSLRALERYYLEQTRDDDLLGIEQRLVEHLPGARDVAGHARLATRLALRPEEALGDAADPILLMAGPRAALDLWLARHVEAAAHEKANASVMAQAAVRAAELMTQPSEHASATLRAAEALEKDGSVGAAAALLEAAVQRAPEHPVAAEELARLTQSLAGGAATAEALELAAKASRVPARVVTLWHRAAVIWQDGEQNDDRALAALDAAATIDPAFDDVYTRLADLLEKRGEGARLATLTEARLAKGGDARFLASLHGRLASLREQQQDTEAAKNALRAALAIEPERLDALRKLAELCEHDDDWRGAAEALIRIARLTKDIDELHGVFFKLGDIYDARMPDAKRSEAAFRRALKLREGDTESMDRLAKLYEREGNFAAAIEMREAHVAAEGDPDRNRQVRLDLAGAFERQGEARKAEAVLEQARRNAPTDTLVLRAFAEFYQRQNAQTALAMHLNRAVNDFRHAIEADLGDAAAWHGLVEVLAWRGRPDQARHAASAAAAIGLVDVDLGRLIDARGGVPGAGGAAADVELDELLAPPMLSLSTRAVFRLAGDAIEKALPPFDLKALRAERVRADTGEIARWFGLPEIEVWITPAAPRVCVPASDRAVLLGRDVYATAAAEERQFLLVRAVKIGRAGMAIAARSQPIDLATVMVGVVRSFDPNFQPPAGLSVPNVDEAGRRFQKALNKRVRDELVPNLYEMVASGIDPSRLGVAAAELADRVALVATGSVPAAVTALLRLAGVDVGIGDPGRLDAVRKVSAARALIDFAISDACFEARHRAGADRR